MKGVLLAGGEGTRLYPLTVATSKHLLPVYDRPMIYYPLSTLMRAGVRDVALVANPGDLPAFQRLLGDGSALGIRLFYIAQPSPDGAAHALLLAEGFVGRECSAVMLGDNILLGDGLERHLGAAADGARRGFASVFAFPVEDPGRFGVVELNEAGEPRSIEEKPECPRSNLAVAGLYFYDGRAADLARQVVPGRRGELEITDLNALYLREGALRVQAPGPGIAWMDAGTVDDLLAAALLARGGAPAPEEIAYRNGWIGRGALLAAAERYAGSPYGARLGRALR